MTPEEIDQLTLDFEDSFQQTNAGFLILSPTGNILRANNRFAGWLACTPEELKGRRFTDFLSVGSKVLYETHLAPLLRMQGTVDEMALEISLGNGVRVPVFISAFERRDADDKTLFIRLTAFRAVNRRGYEENLRIAKADAEGLLADEKAIAELREQFIAVLGHDLRNPLNAISAAAMLMDRLEINKDSLGMVRVIRSSASRMEALISDVLDFAHGRLGGGIPMHLAHVDLEPVFKNVVQELQIASPGRTVVLELRISEPVFCDPARLSQLLSNLVANALTHGSQDEPVFVTADLGDGLLVISVKNRGEPIPATALGQLFQPFSRNQTRPSKHGLGLGLFIAHQIAVGHSGTLEVSSTELETRFTFRMPSAAHTPTQ